MKKLFISSLLICALCFGLVCPVSAVNYDISAPVVAAEETVTPRSFVRNYTDYYTVNGSYKVVVEDPNWDIYNNTSVTVALTSSQGPTKCSVIIYYKEDDETINWTNGGYATIELGGAAWTFSIPQDYTFRVLVKAIEGNNGNATIQVSLK